MSRQFLTPINMSGNAVLNASLNPQSGAPTSPFLGQVYYDTTLLQLLTWTGTAWANTATNTPLLNNQAAAYYLSRANHTGTQLAATISNFVTTAQAITLDTFAAPVAALSVNNQRITSVGNPTSATDAANKNYVDITVQGLTAKPSARAATTAALPTNVYANGTAGVGATLTASAVGALTIDTYAVALGDVVVIKNEATAANNGLYTVTTLGTASVAYILTRHVDMDQATEFGGAFIPVENLGSANANSLWICNVANTITVGTTAVVFTQTNGATDLIPGSGITISGNTVSFLPDPAANKGLTVTGSGAAINFGGTYSWTGSQTMTNSLTLSTSAGTALAVTGAAGGYAGFFQNAVLGLAVNAGSVAADVSFVVNSASGPQYFKVHGDGGAVVGSPTGATKGIGTLNATGYYLNGTALTQSAGANPSASLGLTAVNGVATTFLRSDGAPALSQAITPTWTGAHTFANNVTVAAPTTGVALTVNGFANTNAMVVTASATNGQSYGLSINAGTSALDLCFLASNQAASKTFGFLRGDGSGGFGYNGTANTLTFSATGNVAITAPTSGIAATITGFAGSSALQILTTGMQVGSPTGGELGLGKINASGGFYINGVQVAANAPTRYSAAIGDGTTTAIVVTHGLGTQDTVTSVYSATTPFAEVECDINHTTINTTTLTFQTAPTAGQYRVVLHG